MVRYIIKRILLMSFVLLGVLIFIFTVSRASGDPIPALLGDNFTQEQYDAMYIKLGFDKPLVVQFFDYVKGIVTEFDLGTSYETKRPVLDEVIDRFPISFKLALFALLWSAVLGVVFGLISAVKQYSALDYTVSTTAMVLAAMPSFWVGMMLMLLISLKLGWVSASGLDHWSSWILPCIAIGTHTVAHVCRMTRSAMLEVIRSDYIRTARSKGLSEKVVILKHALRNSAIPIITQIGNSLAVTVGGTAVVESVFSIPGLGSYLVNSIMTKDHPAVQGSVLIFSLFVCSLNFIVDIIYGFVDPRIRAQYSSGKKWVKKNTVKSTPEEKKA